MLTLEPNAETNGAFTRAPGLDVEGTWKRALSSAEADEYTRFVDEAGGGAYVQARQWADAAVAGRRFAVEWFLARAHGRLVGAALVLRPRAVGPLLLPAAVIERGPVTARTEDLADVLGALRREALRRGIVRLEVMPYWADAAADDAERILARAGFRCVQEHDGAHARTLRVDLSGESLFAGKDGESLRRKIRQAEKAGAVARQGGVSDLRALERLHVELMTQQGKHAKPRAYFDALAPIVADGTRGALFLCEHDGEVVSALYASRHGRVATFVIGASDGSKRTFSKMVPAMVAAIRWAKGAGCEAFDLGGIPLEGDADEKRRSISQFKLDFSKAPVRLARAHARWL